MMSVRLTVLLEEELDAKFTAFCQEKGYKKSTLVARLIRDYLARETYTSPSDEGKTPAKSSKKRKA